MPRLSRSVLSSDSVSPLSCLTFASWCPLSLSAGGRVDLTHASVSSPPDASGILSRPRGRVLPCGLDVKRLRCLGRVAFVRVDEEQEAPGPFLDRGRCRVARHTDRGVQVVHPVSEGDLSIVQESAKCENTDFRNSWRPFLALERSSEKAFKNAKQGSQLLRSSS
jgi:hypothetical protein